MSIEQAKQNDAKVGKPNPEKNGKNGKNTKRQTIGISLSPTHAPGLWGARTLGLCGNLTPGFWAILEIE